MYAEVYLCLSIVKPKVYYIEKGGVALYAAYSCIENSTTFKYPWKITVTDALWVTFLGQEIQCM